jgi:hypothetical protein
MEVDDDILSDVAEFQTAPGVTALLHTQCGEDAGLTIA